MNRCLELAKLGESKAFPNPIVGAVIVFEDPETGEETIVGEGFHRAYGEAHAEQNAFELTREEFFKNSSIYVSLEPCAHEGKTPACADLIIKHGFKKLVYVLEDPNPLVSGKGIEKIKAAGIEVLGPEELLLEARKQSEDLATSCQEVLDKAKYLNRKFLKWITSKKPWVTLKIALTADGRMVTAPDEPRWITNAESRKLVHRMRSTHQLLITGIGTVLADDPQMNVRHSAEDLGLADISQPKKLILKSSRDFSDEQRSELKIFQDGDVGEARISEDGDYNSLEELISEMAKHGYGSIMVEAGPKLSKAFQDEGLVDELIHFRAQSGRKDDLMLSTLTDH